jgi:hypothetical protein
MGGKGKQMGIVPQATVHSSLVALAWFAWHSMPASHANAKSDGTARSDRQAENQNRRIEGKPSGVLTEVHDVVAADGAVVHHDVCGSANEDEIESDRTNSSEN